MKDLFTHYLFDKHILVNDGTPEENPFESLMALASLFNIRVREGKNLAQQSMIELASIKLGERVPEPFYEGFPKSVRKLSKDKLLFDQLFHYFTTYGNGDFSEAGHSVFEEQMDRGAFNEKTDIMDFRILSEEDALAELRGMVDGLLAGTRPVSASQYTVIREYILDYEYMPEFIASKNTVMQLVIDTKDPEFAKFLALSDVVKVAELLNYRCYCNPNVNNLNLRNVDRKMLAGLIDYITENGKCNITECYEKKKTWNGLLHHIHYKAKNENGSMLLEAMRNKGNESVYSAFEAEMAKKEPVAAAEVIKEGKGGAALLRHLDYIISRCETEEEIEKVLELTETKNLIVLLQLYIKYSQSLRKGTGLLRNFTFVKFGLTKVHYESDAEGARRKSELGRETTEMIREKIYAKIKELLAGRLGKVYIDPDMTKYSLPLQEGAGQGGFGVLPKGSRLNIGDAKKIRAFTYWEKVNDIDLSVIGITEDGREREFSWRTMADNQSDAIVYSGDETSGYYGGSEYFDINVELFKKLNPDIRYLVFCDNVFTGVPFSNCVCRAGYMLRDIDDTGEIYEPKTVKSSFTINGDSTFSYLFGIDLKSMDFVWLNLTKSSRTIVAGEVSQAFLIDYFYTTDIMNVGKFFGLMATEQVSDPAEADVIVTDKEIGIPEGAEVIHEYDFEKMLKYMG